MVFLVEALGAGSEGVEEEAGKFSFKIHCHTKPPFKGGFVF